MSNDPYNAWVCYHPEWITEPEKAFGVKDIINTVECHTQRGSEVHLDYTPGNDARVVFNLKEAGYQLAGKTHSAEFGVHSPGPTLNPHDIKRTPGTSSSGSAVAVSVGGVPIALGTQTAGSIIRPASYCGVYAYKPSFGLVPRTGILKTADTLDTVGFFIKDPLRIREIFEVIRVKGLNYPFADEMINYEQIDPKQLKVRYLEPTWNELDLKEVEEIHRTIYHKSLSYYFEREMVSPERISDVFKAQVEEGKKISVEEYRAALQAQDGVAARVDDLFRDCDIILVPTVNYSPAPFDEFDREPDMCALWTMAGVPVANVPSHINEGMPTGTSVIARKYCDYKIIRYIEDRVSVGKWPSGPNPWI